MNLDEAILNVLTSSPRALPTPVIATKAADWTGKEESHADVALALRRLQRNNPPLVLGTDKPFVGLVWKETEEGRLAIL